MFAPTCRSSPLLGRLAIVVLVVVGVAVVRPAVAQNTPVAPPEGVPVAPAGAPPAFAVAPGPAPYVQQPPPQMVHRARTGLVVGGAVTFGISWGIAGFVSLVLLGGKNGYNEDACTGNCRDFANVFWIPVAGPILGDVRYPGSEARAALIVWSAIQAAGVTMLAFGIAGHDVPDRRRRVAEGGPTLQLLPMLARGAGGMTLTARW